MKAKKLLSGVMAAAMAFSLAATALAAEGDPIEAPTGTTEQAASGSVKITGTTQTPTIKVAVPTAGTVILNPYKLTVTTKAATDDDDAETSSDQIISATQYIMNRSNMAVRVSASVTGTVAGNAKFATATTVGATPALTTNSAYVVFEMIGADDTTSEVTWDDAATAVLKTAATVVACASDATDAQKDKATLMGAATLTDGAVTAVGDNGYIAFHLTGDAVSTPKTAWAAADKINATVAFTFSPEVVDDAAEEEPETPEEP